MLAFIFRHFYIFSAVLLTEHLPTYSPNSNAEYKTLKKKWPEIGLLAYNDQILARDILFSEGLILVHDVHVWDRWTIVLLLMYSKSLSKDTRSTRGGCNKEGKGNKIRTLVIATANRNNTSSSIFTTRDKYLSCH